MWVVLLINQSVVTIQKKVRVSNKWQKNLYSLQNKSGCVLAPIAEITIADTMYKYAQCNEQGDKDIDNIKVSVEKKTLCK